MAYSAGSDGAAGSTVPHACLTPSSARDVADPRDHIAVGSASLSPDEVHALIAAFEARHVGSRFWAGDMLHTARGMSEDGVEAARDKLAAVSAHVHRQWPAVQCVVLLLRAGALNAQELAGRVHVGAASVEDREQALAALSFAKRELCTLLDY